MNIKSFLFIYLRLSTIKDINITVDIASLVPEFIPGEVPIFRKSILLASDWLMGILENGYQIPFFTTPLSYEEPNTARVLRNLPLVQQLLEDTVSRGIISLVDYKPTCVSPLG